MKLKPMSTFLLIHNILMTVSKILEAPSAYDNDSRDNDIAVKDIVMNKVVSRVKKEDTWYLLPKNF